MWVFLVDSLLILCQSCISSDESSVGSLKKRLALAKNAGGCARPKRKGPYGIRDTTGTFPFLLL